MTENIFPGRFLLKDKIAVVTGGAGLIGKALVLGLAQAGATVIIGEIDKKKGVEVEKECTKKGFNVKWIEVDVTNINSIKIFIKKITDKYKKVDIWVNCAYPRTNDWGAEFENVKYESLKKNVDMQMNGCFLCCQQIIRQMKKQGHGSIINFGSIYGVVGPDFSIYEGTNMTNAAEYAAIKGGVINLTRYLAALYGKDGIRVNAVCPGGIFDHQPQIFVKNYEKNTPLGRMGMPEDIVGPVIFLASDAASYVTGHILMVDGGWTAV